MEKVAKNWISGNKTTLSRGIKNAKEHRDVDQGFKIQGFHNISNI